MYWQQVKSENRYDTAIETFCLKGLNQETVAILESMHTKGTYSSCGYFFYDVRKSEQPDVKLLETARSSERINKTISWEDEDKRIYLELQNAYNAFEKSVPMNVTYERSFDPKNSRILSMISSSFSHGDLSHLAFNLLFFYVFSASIELILGLLLFPAVILSMCVTTHIAYSSSIFGYHGDLPTLGLSGVVMGMMAMLAILIPKAQVRVFCLFIVFVKVISVPAVIIVLMYVVGDVIALQSMDNSSGVNYVSHVVGAATGAAYALAILAIKPRFIQVLADRMNASAQLTFSHKQRSFDSLK